MDILQRIKQLVLRHRVKFTDQARTEMELDGLEPLDVYESILDARLVAMKRSTSGRRRQEREMVYIFVS